MTSEDRRNWLLHETTRRIHAIAGTKFASVLDADALAVIRELSGLLDESTGPDLLGRRALGHMHWFRFVGLHQKSQDGAGKVEFERALEYLDACFAANFGDVPDALTDLLNRRLEVLAARKCLQAEAQPGNPALLDEAVRLAERSVAATRADQPERERRQQILFRARHIGYIRTGSTAALDEAISVARQVAYRDRANTAERSSILAALVGLLCERWESLAEPDDLAEALRAAHLAAAVRAADAVTRTSVTAALFRVGTLFLGRFDRARSTEDLAEAERCVRAAQTQADDAAVTGAWLCIVLREKYLHTGRRDAAVLDEAIAAGRAAAHAVPPGTTDAAKIDASLSKALSARYDRAAAIEDLDEAVAALRRAVLDPDPAMLDDRRAELGRLLFLRFDRTSDEEDLDGSIAATRRSLERATPNHEVRMGRLGNLAVALHRRYELRGVPTDLDAAVEAGREAAPAAGRTRDAITARANLGTQLRDRFVLHGDRADLDEAVSLAREAVAATTDDPDRRSARQCNLAAALQTRYDHFASTQDLDETIAVLGEAARTSSPGFSGMAEILTNQSTAVRLRAELTGSDQDLAVAVEAARTAVGLTTLNPAQRARGLGALGTALLRQAEADGSAPAIDEAISILMAAVEAASANGTLAHVARHNLGLALHTRYTARRDPADLAAAVDLLAQCAESAMAGAAVRISAARGAARLCAVSDPQRAVELIERAVSLLPELAAQRLSRAERQRAVSAVAGLSGDAGALALDHAAGSSPPGERTAHALRLLESARAVLIGQALETRGDVAQLRRSAPELAERYLRLAGALNAASAEESPLASIGGTTRRASAENRIALARSFAETVERIRAQEGSETFCRPLSDQEMTAQAAAGPIITLNLRPTHTDALLLTRTGVSALRLTDAGSEAWLNHMRIYLRALENAANKNADRRAAQAAFRSVLEWLWDAVAGPILDALGLSSAARHTTDALPRIWWSGGAYNLFPLHAAGYHTDLPGEGRRTVMDRAVSSYTPTIRALHHARRPVPAQSSASASLRALVVAMPVTPGAAGGDLPGTRYEADLVRGVVPDSLALIEPDDAPSAESLLANDVPTRARVLTAIPEHAIAHFACHGRNDPDDPSRSQLYLHDHATAPLTAAALASVNLDNAQLAYLSACNTARSLSGTLFDESIHLAGAFQLAGYRHVIGTLWTLGDRISVDVAEDFYTALQVGPGGVLDPSRSAAALHRAVLRQRDLNPGIPTAWAGLIHLGA